MDKNITLHEGFPMPRQHLTIRQETAIKYAVELREHCLSREFCEECPFYDITKKKDELPFAQHCKLNEYPCDWSV